MPNGLKRSLRWFTINDIIFSNIVLNYFSGKSIQSFINMLKMSILLLFLQQFKIMDSILTLMIILALSVQVLPVSLGLSFNQKIQSVILYSFVIIAFQLLLLWLGIITGRSILYLMKGFSGVVIFIGFFLIGIRMILEVFSIRKGERTYEISSLNQIVLASIAQGINTFLTGILLFYIEESNLRPIIIMTLASITFTVIGLILKPNRSSLIIISLITLIAGITMLFNGVYITFFY